MSQTQDPRQGFFKTVAAAMGANPDIEVESTNDQAARYFASAVNLGKLQDSIMELVDKGEIKSLDSMREFIFDSVERPKSLQVTIYKHDGYSFTFELKTKDDCGWYVYEFSTRIIQEDVVESWEDFDTEILGKEKDPWTSISKDQ